MLTFCVPTGRYSLDADSQFAPHSVGAGVGSLKYVILSLYVLLVTVMEAILHIDSASSTTP